MAERKRITSTDRGYHQGHLSVFPKAIDSKFSLFEAVNNAETTLKHSLTSTAKYILVEDATTFPESGILKITADGVGESETVFYGKKIGNQFHLLNRAFNGSKHGPWPASSVVTAPVMAEHHNALKDAIIRIQQKIGLKDDSNNETLSGQLKALEQKWLSPKVNFKSFPQSGPSPLSVRFQNFSSGHAIKFLWDFGDGTTSIEKNPIHVYLNEGVYTVKLNIISSTGSKAFSEKPNYIEVNNQKRKPFFYSRPLQGTSAKTAFLHNISPTNFSFVDQSSGDIVERHWFFGDGKEEITIDENDHIMKHIYEEPGEYTPILMVRYKDNVLSKANILEGIIVT